MTANMNPTESVKPERKNSLAAGVILVVIGLGLLSFQLFNISQFFPLALGLIFLSAGIFTRKTGFIVPGGIITGVGLGTLSTMNAWFFPTNSEESGGLFLLLFSLGWFSITLFTWLFTNDRQTWPLIPGGIMAAIGGLVLMGERGIRILEMAGTYWPLILVIIGLSILWGWWKERK